MLQINIVDQRIL